MFGVLLFSFCVILPYSLGQGCGNLTGVWKNQLGSRVHLHHLDDRTLKGIYMTAVETRPGAAGRGNTLIGSVNDGLLGFTVLWNGNTSVTTWIGQCLTCGEQDVIHTTWLLRRRQQNCEDIWQSTWSNQDVFHRETNVVLRDFPETTISQPNNQPAENGCHIAGVWFDQKGAKLSLTLLDRWSVQGNVSKSFSYINEDDFTEVTGKWDSDDPTRNFGLVAHSSGSPYGKAVSGWAGQCYRCGDQNVLDTMWLMRTPASTCSDSWHHFHVGSARFSKTRPDIE